MGSPWPNYTPPAPTPMSGTCITCGRATTPGRARCHACMPHTPTTPVRRHYKDQHGYAHQQRAKRMIKASPYCAWAYKGGCHGPLTLDYVIPLSLGGQATDENAQILCMRHNVAKGGANRIKR